MEKNRIKVIDSHPGSGKSSYAIQRINESPDSTRVIYITPYLDEVERIIQSCPEKNFIQPSTQKGLGSKLRDFIRLVARGENIVSTHALFSNINDELINLLKINNYTLYLDEVFQTVNKYDFINGVYKLETKEAIAKRDIETLLKKELIKVNSDFTISWSSDEESLSYYDELRKLSHRNMLYLVNNSFLLWSFPIEVFKEDIFSEIYIMTYRFESQLQYYYYKFFDLSYKKYSVYKNKENNKYDISDLICPSGEFKFKESIRDKIHILHDPKLNRIGDIYEKNNHQYSSALSYSWYTKGEYDQMIPVMKNNISNYFNNITKSKASQRLWTSFKENKKQLKSKNVTLSSYIAPNARATNVYSDRTVLCYPINRYIDPFYEAFFSVRNVSIDSDEYALTDMIQWIWRSAIRNENDIQIYIPSQRMRMLLERYLFNEIQEI